MSEHLQRRRDAFTSHTPSPHVQMTMAVLRKAFQTLVSTLDSEIPECREKSLACTALEESSMWAMQALAVTDPEGKGVSL